MDGGVSSVRSSPERKNSTLGEEPFRAGYLFKRSSHSLRPVWCRRYFVLRGDKLLYYSLEGKVRACWVCVDGVVK